MPKPDFRYDPALPVRDPRTKSGAHEDLVLDMATIITLTARDRGESCVTRDDLQRAGFTPAEIERAGAEAVTAAAERLAPRQVEPAKVGRAA